MDNQIKPETQPEVKPADTIEANQDIRVEKELPKRMVNVPLVILGACLCVTVVIGVLVYVLLIKKDGANASTASYIASGANKSGDLATTQKSLEEALRESPDDPGLLAALITTIANEGNLTGTEEVAFQKGKIHVDRGLKAHPEDTELLIAVGLLHEVSGRYDQALSFYEKALSKEPDNSNGLFHKGHVLEFLGRVQESNASYLRAYEIDKEDPLILMALGKMALAQGKTDDSVDFYQAATQAPNVAAYIKAEALTNASIIRRNQMLYMEEAIDLAEQAVEAYPNSSPAHAALGFAYGINGKIVEGVDHMKKAIAANPRISQNYWYLGMLLRSVKEYDDALKYQIEGYARLETDNTLLGNELRAKIKGAMAYDLAKTTYMSGKTDGVMGLLTTALTYDPALKTQLASDVTQYAQFKTLANQAEMKALIQ